MLPEGKKKEHSGLKTFPGFSNGKTHLTPIPAAFFSDLLPIIDDLAELKVSLYAIWFIDQQEGNLRYIRFDDFARDNQFMTGLGKTETESRQNLIHALQRTVDRGSLLCFRLENEPEEKGIYFLNTPLGRAAFKGIQQGNWSPQNIPLAEVQLNQERPNIFRLYEANIGPLTPMMSETLQETEENYPQEWIEDAIRIAVESNVRRWRYVEAILETWKERGRDEKDRRNAQEDPRKYIDDEYGKFIKH